MTGDEAKKRVTVTLSGENVEWLDEKYNNRSGYIDDVLTECREDGGSPQAVVRQMRIEELEEEADELEREAEHKLEKAKRKRQKAEEFRAETKQVEQQREVELDEAREALEHTPLEPSNPAVKSWADDLGLTAVELIEELEDGENQ